MIDLNEIIYQVVVKLLLPPNPRSLAVCNISIKVMLLLLKRQKKYVKYAILAQLQILD